MGEGLDKDYQDLGVDPARVRPRDLDEALSRHASDTMQGIDKLSQGIEGVKKRTAGIWGVAVAFAVGVWYLSSFVTTYNSVMANGSPAMLTMKGELATQIASIKKADDDRYGQLSDILVELKASNEITQKRLDRLEDAKR